MMVLHILKFSFIKFSIGRYAAFLLFLVIVELFFAKKKIYKTSQTVFSNVIQEGLSK